MIPLPRFSVARIARSKIREPRQRHQQRIFEANTACRPPGFHCVASGLQMRNGAFRFA